MHYAISENGTLVYMPGLSEGNKRQLIKIGFNGEIETLDLPLQAYVEPRISPDGKKITLVIGSGKNFDVWIYEFKSNNLTRLTFGGINRTPIWSPDGKSIAYCSNVNNKLSIKIKNSDGSGDARTIITNKNRLYIDGWTPDGANLIVDTFLGKQQSGMVVYSLSDTSNANIYINTEADEYMGDLSTDGKWFAYASNESGPYEIYVQPFPENGGKWQISINGGLEPRWSADGKTLYYNQGSKIIMVPISTNEGVVKTGKEKIVFDKYSALPVDSGISYDVSPVGEYFISTQIGSIASYQQVNVIVNWFSELQSLMQNNR